MVKILSKILQVTTSIYYSFHFFFFWMFESTDSLFYYTFAEFIKTGKYFMPHPYYFIIPSTMEPPLYSVFLFLAGFFPRADIIVHLAQLTALLLSGFFIYKITKHYFSKELSVIAACIFLLTPAHFIYSANLVAEPIAVFFITFYLYLVHKILNEKKMGLLGPLLLLSAVATLQRYNLIVFFAAALFLLIIKTAEVGMTFLKGWARSKSMPPRSLFLARVTRFSGVEILFLFLSVGILGSWVFINHNLNGSWGLSNAEGKHLYNRILHFDKLIPPDDNPTFQKFKTMVGEGKDYFKPWWFYEEALIASLGNETRASHFMGEVAIEALKTNPAKYLMDFIPFFIFAHSDNHTYHDKLYLWNEGQSRSCRTLGSISLCKPIVNWDFSRKIWDTAVRIIDNYYLNFSKYLNFSILFPALVWSIFQKDRFMKFAAFLYISSILFFVAFEAPLPRYTYIFTPLKTIIIFYFLLKLSGQNDTPRSKLRDISVIPGLTRDPYL